MQKFIYHEKVYSYQIDFARHLSNIIYIEWLENGRVKLLEEIGMPVEKIAEQEGIVPILTDTSIKYKKPFLMGDTATIELWVSKLHNASLILEFRFYNQKKELCAEANQKGLFMDHDTMRPKRITEKHRKAFERFVILES